MSKKALITGINGQDGSYLSELLLEKGYEVYGIIRRHSVPETQTSRIQHLFSDINLIYGDLLDSFSIINIIKKVSPDEIYNLGAQSHVRISFDLPYNTMEGIIFGTLNILEAMRLLNKNIRLYQASSSEMFGNSTDLDGAQRENTPMHPVSPYGCAKLCAYNLCNNYKNAYGLFISNGILFNHESPRRGSNFISSKIVQAAKNIKTGKEKSLSMGNLEACRDWGHAKDYVEVMHKLLQLNTPENIICATGVTHSVREMCEYVFSKFGLDYKKYVVVDQKFIRPEELNYLRGDPSKIKKILNWEHKYTFETMLDDIINYYINN